MTKDERREIFAQAHVNGGMTLSDAYREAYPTSKKWKLKSVNEKACEFAKDVKVMSRTNELKSIAAKKIRDKFNMTLNDTLVELMHIAKFNPKDLVNPDGSSKDLSEIPDETMRALAQVEFGQMNKVDELGEVIGNVTYISKYSPSPKVQALSKILEFQLAEEKPPEDDDDKPEVDPTQLARRIISLIFAAKQKKKLNGKAVSDKNQGETGT